MVPSYRTGAFLDPKGRGMTSGYDFAHALPGLQNGNTKQGEEELFNENNKKFDGKLYLIYQIYYICFYVYL